MQTKSKGMYFPLKRRVFIPKDYPRSKCELLLRLLVFYKIQCAKYGMMGQKPVPSPRLISQAQDGPGIYDSPRNMHCCY